MNGEQTPLRTAGIFFIRVLLGIIFFFQGYGKIFSIGVDQVYDKRNGMHGMQMS